MNVYETTQPDTIHIELSPDEASMIRACLYREGRQPGKAVIELRSILWKLENPHESESTEGK